MILCHRQTDRQTDRGLFAVDLRRIGWVDIAKGIAIILVIIGHTVSYGSATRNFIFSFHMPLFFLLSGYTYKIATERSAFLRHLRKGLRHLIVPSLIVSLITIIGQWLFSEQYTFAEFWQLCKRMGDALWWASGVNVHSHPGLGAIWFLVSLFWAKLIMDVLRIIFPSEKVFYLFVFLSLFGIALGAKGHWLPQNMDTTFVAILFIALGMLWRRYHDIIEKHNVIIFLCAMLYWITCLKYNIYLEMATRNYPYILVSVVEAVAGSYAICCVCQALAANHKISYVLQFVGMHTLIIFLVHHLDWILKGFWQVPSVGVSSCLRVIIVLMFAFGVYAMNYWWQNKKVVGE